MRSSRTTLSLFVNTGKFATDDPLSNEPPPPSSSTLRSARCSSLSASTDRSARRSVAEECASENRSECTAIATPSETLRRSAPACRSTAAPRAKRPASVTVSASATPEVWRRRATASVSFAAASSASSGMGAWLASDARYASRRAVSSSSVLRTWSRARLFPRRVSSAATFSKMGSMWSLTTASHSRSWSALMSGSSGSNASLPVDWSNASLAAEI
mmetsp:Transcript_10344/g.24168  ORF Transcript_10344/g.24168 Transcript_10344/m.24168 type:complete len:216 (-) Transcript_10344:123-770(-)